MKKKAVNKTQKFVDDDEQVWFRQKLKGDWSRNDLKQLKRALDQCCKDFLKPEVQEKED